jgi:hypothetical protein
MGHGCRRNRDRFQDFGFGLAKHQTREIAKDAADEKCEKHPKDEFQKIV